MEEKNLTYTNMPDYIEPAAAAANAVFGSTASNDTWNSWDVDVRSGAMGGYNYIQGTAVPRPFDGDGGYSTLYDGTGTGNPVQIRSISGGQQHNGWVGLPTTGSGFQQLVGGEHSAGTNSGPGTGSYSVQISGLTAGDNFLFLQLCSPR